jgi:Flp pilus assembly pilin Flp
MLSKFDLLYVKLLCLARQEDGQDLAEYGLLFTLIAVTMVASLKPIADHIIAALSPIEF